MHMADALISPAVGGSLWALSGTVIAVCARKVRHSLRDNLVPMMGVMGAFIFAAQMINFTIPATGSSGHLGGGLILSILLGPYAALLVIASVLTVQAFFFADGGLLALGCNIFNLGFFPAFVAYPLYRIIAAGRNGGSRAWAAAIAAAVLGMLLGASGVVVQTTASGVSALPFKAFMAVMLPIHLAIGLVEGLATAAVVAFVGHARPEALSPAAQPLTGMHLRPKLIGLALATLVLGGVAAWFASTRPDGLEWSIERVTGESDIAVLPEGLHRDLAALQERTAYLPGYAFRPTDPAPAPVAHSSESPEPWPDVSVATSASGVVGGLLTLALALLTGVALTARGGLRLNANH